VLQLTLDPIECDGYMRLGYALCRRRGQQMSTRRRDGEAGHKQKAAAQDTAPPPVLEGGPDAQAPRSSALAHNVHLGFTTRILFALCLLYTPVFMCDSPCAEHI
jgi:hypothetical protein